MCLPESSTVIGLLLLLDFEPSPFFTVAFLQYNRKSRIQMNTKYMYTRKKVKENVDGDKMLECERSQKNFNKIVTSNILLVMVYYLGTCYKSTVQLQVNQGTIILLL